MTPGSELTAPDSSSPPTWRPQPRPLAAPSPPRVNSAQVQRPLSGALCGAARAGPAGKKLRERQLTAAAGAQLGSDLLQLLCGQHLLQPASWLPVNLVSQNPFSLHFFLRLVSEYHALELSLSIQNRLPQLKVRHAIGWRLVRNEVNGTTSLNVTEVCRLLLLRISL